MIGGNPIIEHEIITYAKNRCDNCTHGYKKNIRKCNLLKEHIALPECQEDEEQGNDDQPNWKVYDDRVRGMQCVRAWKM
jgi:hypothetical protein